MIVYLSGPMSGRPFSNYQAFNGWAKYWRQRGYEVLNPAENFGGADAESHPEGRKAFMRLDIEYVLQAEAVAVLPGWQSSKGARLEVAIGRELELPILDVRTMEPYSDTVVEEAQRLVLGDRGGSYGHPFDDFSRTAGIWAEILGIEVTPEQVALCMIGVKLSRLVQSPDHRDSVVDVAGYALTYDMVRERRKEQQA